MTNLIAIVSMCIVTNVTHWDNEKRVPHAFMYNPDMPPGSIIQPMTEKTETTEVVEVKTLKFTWEGEEYTTKRERVLSRKVRKWVKKEEWGEQ